MKILIFAATLDFFGASGNGVLRTTCDPELNYTTAENKTVGEAVAV